MRLLAMAGVALGVLAFFVFLSLRLNTTELALLYGDLSPGDSARITAKLDAMAVPYQIADGGSKITVPADQVASLRMAMAEEGLPDGGSIGYDIFDKTDALGTTSFAQNVNLLRALEGELSRSIESLKQVATARVHLVLPKRELFSREKRDPSASVILRTSGGERLGGTQVAAIQQLVSAAVPGLAPTQVSIVDHKGRLLARSGDPNAPAIIASRNEEYKTNEEIRLTRIIEDLVGRSVGAENVRAHVALDMGFDRITTESETYDPDGQVVRSTQLVEENARNREADGASSVSVANNLPDAGGSTSQSGTSSQSARTEETTNYEISKTVRHHVHETGTIERMSIAVLVDGTYATDAAGTQVYKPRTKEELDQLAAVVRSAVGFDEKRGDTLEVVNMRFASVEPADLEQVSPLLGLTKADYFRIAEIFILAIVGILVILLVVRPLVARTLEALPKGLDNGAEQALLTDRSEDPPALPGPAHIGMGEDEDDELIDLAAVDGRVRSSTVKKIVEIVDRHPEETVGIIRQWMYQDS